MDSGIVSTEIDVLKIIKTFRGISKDSSIWSMKRKDVADRLEELIKNPNLIRQGRIDACGPAAFFQVCILRDSCGFADFAQSLYNVGYGYIGSKK